MTLGAVILAAIQSVAAPQSGISPREVGELLGLVTVAVGLVVGAFKLGSYSRDQVAHEERVSTAIATLTQLVAAHATLDLTTFDTVRRDAIEARVAADLAKEKALAALVAAAELTGRVTRLDDPTRGALLSMETQVTSIRTRLHDLAVKIQAVYGREAAFDLRLDQSAKDATALGHRVEVIEDTNHRSGLPDRRQA